ncbi:MAG: hypothetical protein GWN01_15065, partial [Nitrosopumilaceae archaeon]|nr:hypothetical protein [Nitrosopumilaceae archaeon]NIU87232.1 hypothetical protein [Nitrosopumilaceae archaeon]NIV65765.1 hypothetical protein [Nitrosopumilaceae archaeon]NIX62767.1 hypothetical protein [Nitrosopumilaceae archaeon]
HQPHFVEIGDELGANYTGGTETVFATYPSIEAINRPAQPHEQYYIGVKITPNAVGNFSVFVKSVDI